MISTHGDASAVHPSAITGLLSGLAEVIPGEEFDARLRAVEAGLDSEVAARIRAAAHAARATVRTERRRAARLLEVIESTGELVAVHNVDAVLREITSRARRLLNCDYVYLNTPEPAAVPAPDGPGSPAGAGATSVAAAAEPSSYAIRAWSGDLAPEFLGIPVSPGLGVGGVVLQTGQPYQVADYATARPADTPADYAELLARQQISTLLATPLVVDGRITGLLFAARTHEEKFSDDEVFLLSALARHAAIALQNAELDERRERALREVSVAAERSESKRAEEERQSRLHARLNSVVLDGAGVSEVLAAVCEEAATDVAYVDRATGSAVVASTPPTSTPAVSWNLPEPSVLAAPRGELPRPELREVQVGRRRWAVIDVVAYSRALGHLVARTQALEDPATARLLQWTSQAVALCQLSTQALADAERRTATEVVRKLVSSSSSPELRRKLHRSGIGPDGLRILLCDSGDPSLERRLTRWTVRHSGIAAVVDEVAVVLAPAGRSDSLATLATTLSEELGGIVVLSRAVEELETIRPEFTRTLRSLHLARALGYAGEVVRVEQFGVFSMLFTDPTAEDLDDFIRAQAGPLLDSDNRHGTALAATALALLDHAGGVRAAAAELDVHPNTITQRAGRIARLLGPGWRAQPRAFEVHAGLKLHRLRAEAGRWAQARGLGGHALSAGPPDCGQ
ncbi:helix-turn-helix domain-containing protein [Dietzia aurantiaca]|uniref:GAF domain-containing protein n=1 Tax=Dietzia aurantiaca TaxID=983873 RepID=A0ABV9PQL9_9ACTN